MRFAQGHKCRPNVKPQPPGLTCSNGRATANKTQRKAAGDLALIRLLSERPRRPIVPRDRHTPQLWRGTLSHAACSHVSVLLRTPKRLDRRLHSVELK